MGTYSEWDEEKKLEFLTREFKGKRPLVPSSMESSTRIGHLWAIPWVFAWTRTRFVLPAWVELNQV
ncbi:putative phosphoenolpyruvate carboxylase [Rosa chinensis]|uniref:Putative phosphoenolpyruvate carboxylase n=1 Tax=Rosa chinensis TaxID=74649 RepID=A0A2P6QUH9_ROSCH|nr:putative phosphoenolpyruvate carboxylase [Rosa chinensis]